MSNRRSEAGLTMTEILVVILIMGILAGILVPALSAAKRKARQTTCASNMRQMGLAFGMYAVDWRNKLPHPDASLPDKRKGIQPSRCPEAAYPCECRGDPSPHPACVARDAYATSECPYCWFYAIDQYVAAKSGDRKASIKQDPIYASLADEAGTGLSTKEKIRTIKMNSNMAHSKNCRPRFRPLATIEAPNKTVLLFDGRINSAGVADNYDGIGGSVDNRHSDGANFLFVNNRVQWYGEDDQTDLVWSP